MLYEPVTLLIPDAEYGQLICAGMTAPLLYLNGEAWWWYSMVGLVATRGDPEAEAIRHKLEPPPHGAGLGEAVSLIR
jgi:hypothetical protein